MVTHYRSESNPFFRALPKVELHRHLEGSLRVRTLQAIAEEYDLDVPHRDPAALQKAVQISDGEPFTFSNFLSKFDTLRKFYRSPEIIERVTGEAIEDASLENIRYLELRFTPVALSIRMGFSIHEVMSWVHRAAGEAARRHGVVTRLIASVNRHEPVDWAEQVVACAVECREHGVVGLDLAGNEAEYPAAPFAPLFREAGRAGLRLTAHAGEWGGAANVVEAIEDLHAERIGHGVRVMEDERAVGLARERGTAFEVCPTSNLQTGVVASLQEHPLKGMIDAGLRATLNTDDPSISAIDLSNEYRVARQTLRLSIDQLRELTLQSARVSFLDSAGRERLESEIREGFGVTTS